MAMRRLRGIAFHRSCASSSPGSASSSSSSSSSCSFAVPSSSTAPLSLRNHAPVRYYALTSPLSELRFTLSSKFAKNEKGIERRLEAGEERDWKVIQDYANFGEFDQAVQYFHNLPKRHQTYECYLSVLNALSQQGDEVSLKFHFNLMAENVEMRAAAYIPLLKYYAATSDLKEMGAWIDTFAASGLERSDMIYVPFLQYAQLRRDFALFNRYLAVGTKRVDVFSGVFDVLRVCIQAVDQVTISRPQGCGQSAVAATQMHDQPASNSGGIEGRPRRLGR